MKLIQVTDMHLMLSEEEVVVPTRDFLHEPPGAWCADAHTETRA